MYNEDEEQVEYLQESICLDDADVPSSSILMDFSDYWDEETIAMLKDVYFLAEAWLNQADYLFSNSRLLKYTLSPKVSKKLIVNVQIKDMYTLIISWWKPS